MEHTRCFSKLDYVAFSFWLIFSNMVMPNIFYNNILCNAPIFFDCIFLVSCINKKCNMLVIFAIMLFLCNFTMMRACCLYGIVAVIFCMQKLSQMSMSIFPIISIICLAILCLYNYTMLSAVLNILVFIIFMMFMKKESLYE
jgi:hypothetical protein